MFCFLLQSSSWCNRDYKTSAQSGSPFHSFCVVQKKLADTILGRVDLARRADTGQAIVVKTSFLHRKESIKTHEDPRTEARLLRKLGGTQIVPELVGEWMEQKVEGMPGVHRYAMEYGGLDLYGFITHNDHLSELQSRPLFLQILKAVQLLHTKKIVHLDLKTENILINSNLKILLCDLGQAREIKTPKELHSGITGTESYRAPEIIQASRYEGELADMYSLGVILFIMLLGCPPYRRPYKSDKAFNCIYHARGVAKVANCYARGTTISLSPPVLDLLGGLLCPPHLRLTMAEVMRHPWINPSS